MFLLPPLPLLKSLSLFNLLHFDFSYLNSWQTYFMHFLFLIHSRNTVLLLLFVGVSWKISIMIRFDMFGLQRELDKPKKTARFQIYTVQWSTGIRMCPTAVV